MNRTRLSRQFGVVTRAVVEQTVSRGGGSGNSGGHMRLEDEPFDLRQRLDEVERRLRAIEELALSQVVVVGMPNRSSLTSSSASVASTTWRRACDVRGRLFVTASG
jgi:hypothetical protein